MIEVVGAAVVLPQNDQLAWIPLQPGLNVLYGKNGTGKTNLLWAFASATVAQRSTPGLGELLYKTGSVQLHMPITSETLAADPTGTELQIAAYLAGLPPDLDADLGVVWPDATRAYRALVERTAEQTTRAGLPSLDAARALALGHLLVVPVHMEHGVGTAVYLGLRPSEGADATELFRSDLSAQQVDYAMYGVSEGAYQTTPAPSPENLGFRVPDWAALPAAYLGSVPWPLVVAWSTGLFEFEGSTRGSAEELATQAWDAAIRRVEHQEPHLRHSWSRPSEGARSRSVVMNSLPGAQIMVDRAVARELVRISRRASDLLAQLVEEAPVLQLVPGPSLAYPMMWMAFWDPTPRIGLDSLGDAHRRMAKLAIQQAIWEPVGDDSLPRAEIVLIDEPERASHAAAARRIASALPALGDVVVAASHSLDVIDLAPSLLHVGRSGDRTTIDNLQINLRAEDRSGLAARLGVPLAQLVTMVRVIVLVEGPHDQDVISAFCRDELADSRATVITLGGHHGLAHLAEARWLIHATSASLLVVLDNLPDTSKLNAALARMRRTTDPDQQHKVRYGELKSGRQTPERKALDAMIDAAISTRCIERFHAFGFEERDIARYLPATEVLPGAHDWDEVKERFLAAKNQKSMKDGDGERLKRWVKEQGGDHSPVGIRKAAERVAMGWDAGEGRASERPPEFTELARTIRRLAVR